MMEKKNQFTGVVSGILAGIFVAFMVRLNASLGESIGILESSFVVHLVGAVFALPLVFLFGKFSFQNLKTIPKYLFLGGVLGILIVVISNGAVPHLGMVLTVSLFLAGNLFFGAIADHFGFFGLPRFPMNTRRGVGLLCALVGLVMLLV